MSVDVDQMDEEFGCMGIHEKHKTNKGKGRDYVTVGNYEELQLAIAAYDKISIAVSQGSFHFYDDIVITNKQVEIYPAKEGQMPTFLSHGKNASKHQHEIKKQRDHSSHKYQVTRLQRKYEVVMRDRIFAWAFH